MPKYKIGDRVMVHLYEHEQHGKKGTVIEESNCPWIRFDNPTGYNGSSGEELFPGWKTGYMDCCDEERLTLVQTAVEQAVDEALGLVSVSFRIPVELHEALTAIAKDKGYVLPAVVREALSHYVYGA